MREATTGSFGSVCFVLDAGFFVGEEVEVFDKVEAAEDLLEDAVEVLELFRAEDAAPVEEFVLPMRLLRGGMLSS